jgi:hypothetical protein
VRLANVYAGKLSGLKYKFVCHFKLAVDMDRVFVYDVDKPAFLKRKLVEFGVDKYQYGRVQNSTSGPVPIHMFEGHVTHFFYVYFIHWSWYTG